LTTRRAVRPPDAFDFLAGVSAVLFDAGNTLLWIDHARIAEILTGAGVACDEGAVRVAEMRARPRLDPFLARTTKRESAETISRYVDLILEGVTTGASSGARPSAGPAKGAVIDAWRTLWVRPPADAHATLADLSRRGYRLGVVSNSSGNVLSLLEDAGLAASLACVVDSGVVGVEKPDPRIFAMAAARLALPPSACVYVGDYFSLDVVGPRAAGMHAVLLDPIGAWGDVAAPRASSLTELVSRFPATAPRARPGPPDTPGPSRP
jgi:HAD superfamily hydrolase (TIGR01509 family)